jgi:hypothetical protein
VMMRLVNDHQANTGNHYNVLRTCIYVCVSTLKKVIISQTFR